MTEATTTTATDVKDAAATTTATTAADTTKTATTTTATADVKTTDTKTADAATIIGDKTGATATADVKQVAPADWPADWRDKLAEQIKPGDKDFRTRLDRFAAPADIGKSWLGLEQRLKSGELKAATPFPDKGTDAEKTAWRAEHKVPESADGYKIELKNGMVVGEADKPLVGEFAKWAHGQHWDQSRLNDTLQFYYELQDKQSQALVALDGMRKQEAEDALRAELGTDYRRTVNAVDNFLSGWPAPLVAQLQGARGADGGLLFDNPLFVKALAATALELNPAATLVPTTGGGAQGVATRLAEIRKIRQETPDKYDADKAMQTEELQLLDAQLKLQGRGKAA